MMLVRSLKSAERRNSPWLERNHARGKAYCARLKLGERQTIDREFVKRAKSSSGAELLLSVVTRPGDIYEIRRWWFDHDRQTYFGGTVWIGFDDANQPFVLTREEAFDSVINPPARPADREGQALVSIVASRIIPAGIEFL